MENLQKKELPESGFTLIELMVVVGIVAVLGMIAVPNIIKQLPERNLSKAAREMSSALRTARAMAIKRTNEVTIEFDAAKNTYSYLYPADQSGTIRKITKELPRGIKFGYAGRTDPVTFAADQLIFNRMGLTTGGQDCYAYFENSNNPPGGYRVGIRGMASSIVMEKCGSPCKKIDGASGTLDCRLDGAAACR